MEQTRNMLSGLNLCSVCTHFESQWAKQYGNGSRIYAKHTEQMCVRVFHISINNSFCHFDFLFDFLLSTTFFILGVFLFPEDTVIVDD